LATEFRRLELPVGGSLSAAIADFDCVPKDGEADKVAETVCEFFRTHKFEAGIRGGFSSTYLLVDPDRNPALVGYATLTYDSIRLTNTEKRQMEDLAGIRQFGALRIQMIGVDHRHHRSGCGAELLRSITGLARRLSDEVAVRFILADANVRKVTWYEDAGFVPNRSDSETKRVDPDRSVSMRLDLIDLPEPSSDLTSN
jgi:GNAT superfamily N-acetyltransferase